MPTPINFDSQTPRFDLPLLYAGQSQKELFVNEGAARVDALLHCAVESEASTPPGTANDGECWLVTPAATGAWSGKDGEIAARIGGGWVFIAPRDGMLILNRETGQTMRYNATWLAPARPAAPSGGTVVDAEARASISAILTAMGLAGIIPAV